MSARSRSKRNKPSKQNAQLPTLLIGLGCVIALIAFFVTNHLFAGRSSAGLSKHQLSAQQKQSNAETILQRGFHSVKCRSAEAKSQATSQCEPRRCARMLKDDFVNAEEVAILRSIPETAFKVTGGGSGPVSIFDLISGATSRQDKFIDLYRSQPNAAQQFTLQQLETFRAVVRRVHSQIVESFAIEKPQELRLASPSFFSRITNRSALTPNDAYYHVHDDSKQYKDFTITTLLYLNSHQTDYEGGRFVFVDSAASSSAARKSIVVPRAGLLSAFTSGSENLHHIEQVTSGSRLAVTIAFSCQSGQSIDTLLDKQIAQVASAQPLPTAIA